jgi:hypothetical protein
MYRSMFIVVAFAVTACSSRASRPSSPHSAATAGSVYGRVPDRVGDFALTERTAIAGSPNDSAFRFSDGSATRLSVIQYDVDEDVKIGPDSQKWIVGEGEKFQAVQEIRRNRGQIASYVVVFTDTTRLSVGDRERLEHSTGVSVRLRNDAVVVELQYLYLIGGKFVKVRATVPEQGWQQTEVPTFARELARHLARGT